MKTKIVSCHTSDSKPVKQEVNGTVILLAFPGLTNSTNAEAAVTFPQVGRAQT